MSKKQVCSINTVRALVLASTFLAAPALAQTAPAAAPTSQDDSAAGASQTSATSPETTTMEGGDQGRIADIVVTAQRRTERLQNVPISVQILSGQAIAKQDLTSLQNLSRIAPSVHVSSSGAGGQLFIRGIGSGTNQTFDQSVGIFIDDLYHGTAQVSSGTFLDLERVEILKGPQSTYFGNNAIAGAFNIVTAKPTDRFEGSVRGSYGSFGRYVTEAVVNVPVSDTLAVRIAGNANGLSGWQKNPYRGENAPNAANQAGRITALFRPSDAFDATLKVEGSHNRTHAGNVIGDCPPPAPFVPAGYCRTAIALGLPTGVKSDVNTNGSDTGQLLNTFETALTMNYHLGDGATLTSVTGYYKYRSEEDLDADATPQNLLNFEIDKRYHQFSQELRYASAPGKPIEYLVGGYFQVGHIDGNPGALTYFTLNPTIIATPAYAALVPYLPLASSPSYVQTERSYAVFGALTWNVTDKFKVTGGLRATWDRKNSSLSAFYGTGTRDFGGIVALPDNLQQLAARLLGMLQTSAARATYRAVIPSARLQYNVARDAMFYFSYANGFKAGVPVTAFAGVLSPALNPEHVNAYEVGFKSELFDRRVLFNVDVFRSDYQDLQVFSNIFNANLTTSSIITNAGSSRSQGIEVEGQWAVSKAFRLSTAFTYLDAKYLNYPNVTNTGILTFCRANPTNAQCAATYPNPIPALQNLSGRPTGFAPKWSGNLTASYVADLGSYRLTTDVTGLYSSSYYYANNGTDDDQLKQGKYGRLDFSVALESPNRRWQLSLIGKNMTDAYIVSGGNGGTSLPSSLGSILYARDEPRNVAVQIRYKW